MYLSRQLYEEALHVQFYLTLLDTYVPDPEERHRAFAAVENIPSIRKKAEFCMRWIDSIQELDRLETRDAPAAVPAQPDLLRGLHRGALLLRRVRLRLLPALARAAARPRRRGRTGCSATRARTWRSPSRWCAPCAREEPELFDDELDASGRRRCSTRPSTARRSSPRTCSAAASSGCRSTNVRQYLEFCADQRLATLGLPKRYGAKNPLSFMDLQDVQEVTNFFERRVSAYQVGVQRRGRVRRRVLSFLPRAGRPTEGNGWAVEALRHNRGNLARKSALSGRIQRPSLRTPFALRRRLTLTHTGGPRMRAPLFLR